MEILIQILITVGFSMFVLFYELITDEKSITAGDGDDHAGKLIAPVGRVIGEGRDSRPRPDDVSDRPRDAHLSIPRL